MLAFYHHAKRDLSKGAVAKFAAWLGIKRLTEGVLKKRDYERCISELSQPTLGTEESKQCGA